MGYNIAVAGKGGTGKTSLTGLLINNLTTNNKGPVLVVDADANANINEVLGIEVETTIGSIREEVSQREKQGNTFPGGMTKAQYLQYRLNTCLAEGDGYDLMVMGRSEGEGCVGEIHLIVNKAPNGNLNDGIKEEIAKHNLNLIGVVPMDEMIYEYDSSGIPLVNLPEDSKAKIAINDIMAKLELN